jgi:hypothetical protein
MSELSGVPRLSPLERRFVQPFYRAFLHANYVQPGFATPAEQSALKVGATIAAREARTEELAELLALGDWRPRLAAGYLVGIDRRHELLPLLARELAGARFGFAAQGYVFALVRAASPEARTALERHTLVSVEGIDEPERCRTLAALSLVRGQSADNLEAEVAAQRARLEVELRFWSDSFLSQLTHGENVTYAPDRRAEAPPGSN